MTMRHDTWTIDWRPPDGFFSALESSPDSVAILDLDATIQFVNSRAAVTLADSCDAELIGRPWVTLWSGRHRADAEAALVSVRAGAAGAFVATRPTVAGHVRHLHTIISPLGERAGETVAWLVTSRDVTPLEEARLAAEIRDLASAHHAAALRQVAEMLHLNNFEADLRQVFLSEEGVKSVRGDPNRTIVPISDALAQYIARDRPRVEEQINRLLATGSRINYDAEICRLDGSHGWIRVFAEPVYEGGEYVGVRGAAMDISAEVTARETIERAKQRLKLAAHLVGMEVYELDFEQQTLVQEGSAASILEHPLIYEDLWPAPLDLIDTRDRARVQEEWRLARQTGAPFRSEFRTQRQDGRERWVYAVGELVQDAGRPRRLLGAVVDVTERKRAERALLETLSKMREHEAHQKLLLDELNHRVKNTLAAVQSVATQTLSRAREPEEARELFIDRLLALSLTHDLLVKSAWDRASFSELVNVCLEPFGRTYRYQGSDLQLDPNYTVSLGMALHELAINALKHGAWRQDGEVDITTAVGDAGVRITWRERGGPRVSAPSRRGFGSRLLERALARELGGTVTLHFAPEGLACEIAAPASTRIVASACSGS